MQPPTTKRQLRRFLGMVNYYRDMWKQRSHILAPLTALSSKVVPWKWTEECNEAFEKIKRTMSRETLLNFPDFTKEFHVYTDASDYQQGAVIMQENKPLAFYSRKLNRAQKNYTTGEQELLSIVETLKEFKNILFGQKVIVHTDHLNLLYNKLPSPRVTRWRIMLEEFGPKFVHIKGEQNIVADTLSRHQKVEDENEEEDGEETPLTYTLSRLVGAEDIEEESDFPLSPKVIQKHQQRDQVLQEKAKAQTNYGKITLEGETLISKNHRVAVPKTLQDRLVETYHNLLQHPGSTRMEATIRHVFDFAGLREKVETYCKTCHVCQLSKKQRKKYGHLPPKEAEEAIPWKRVNVDVVGPYKVKVANKELSLLAMTMIDPATGWFEIAHLPEATSYETQKAFDSHWLARYPRPMEVGMDNGSHFK